MSARIDLSESWAGDVRVRVGNKTFQKWYSVHTPLEQILFEAFVDETLQSLGLSVSRATIVRSDQLIGLIEVAEPIE